MFNCLVKMDLTKIPVMFESDDMGIHYRNKIIHLHFRADESHWYVVEHDGKNQFYGFVVFENNFQNAKWKEFSAEDLWLPSQNYVEVSIDQSWIPVKAESVELIKKANNWT